MSADLRPWALAQGVVHLPNPIADIKSKNDSRLFVHNSELQGINSNDLQKKTESRNLKGLNSSRVVMLFLRLLAPKLAWSIPEPFVFDN